MLECFKNFSTGMYQVLPAPRDWTLSLHWENDGTRVMALSQAAFRGIFFELTKTWQSVLRASDGQGERFQESQREGLREHFSWPSKKLLAYWVKPMNPLCWKCEGKWTSRLAYSMTF